MPPIRIGDVEASDVFVGDMGVKAVCIGDTEIYTRPGAYLYIELSNKEE